MSRKTDGRSILVFKGRADRQQRMHLLETSEVQFQIALHDAPLPSGTR